MSEQTLLQLANKKYVSFEIDKKREVLKNLLICHGFELTTERLNLVFTFNPTLGVYCEVRFKNDSEDFNVDLSWWDFESNKVDIFDNAIYYFATQNGKFAWLINEIKDAINKAEI